MISPKRQPVGLAHPNSSKSFRHDAATGAAQPFDRFNSVIVDGPCSDSADQIFLRGPINTAAIESNPPGAAGFLTSCRSLCRAIASGYPDEPSPRDICTQELYFGATEIKYDEETGIIYVRVVGRNAVFGPDGDRIFEYDASRRSPVRDYWIEVRD